MTTTLLSLALDPFAHIPALVALGIVLAWGLAWPAIKQRLQLRSFPLLKNEYYHRRDIYIQNRVHVYQQSYDKSRDEFHRIPTPDGNLFTDEASWLRYGALTKVEQHIIIPNGRLNELRDRGDDEVDVLKGFMRILENRYLKLFPPHRKTFVLNGTVKKELNRALVRINPALSRVVEETVSSNLPSSTDWSPIKINKQLLRIVAIASGCIFFGPEICMREEYLQVSAEFAVHQAMAAPALKRWHPILRPLANYIEPAPRALRADRAKLKKFLSPIITERRAAKERGEALPDDFLQWLLENTDAAGIKAVDDITSMMLLLIFAAIHTTTQSVTFMIYDMVYHPEVVDDCRKEIKKALEEHDGVMTTKALFSMKLLDSVMKESQRMNSLFAESFRRYTLKSMTLRDGTVIPKGCMIETPNQAVLMDPKLYPNPEKFDPYRFWRIRTSDAPDPMGYKNREQYQFVSVTSESMSFGFGRHACPGRFFAANEIKLILAQILLHYDLKLPDDSPEDVRGLLPDPNREILFRRISENRD